MANVKPIPEGSHTLTAGLVIKGAQKAIDYYKSVFGAQVLGVSYMPDGKSVMHAELKIGDTKIYLGDEMPEMGALSPQSLGGSPVSLNLYVDDCDTVFNRAVTAGAKPGMPPADMFWGDRYGKLTDPFGHQWGIATHIEDVSKEEMDRRAVEFMAAMAKK